MRWEYHRLSVDGPSLESALSELGQDGWELVSVLAETRIFYGYQCFLKRPIADSDVRPLEPLPEKRPADRVAGARRLNNYADRR